MHNQSQGHRVNGGVFEYVEQCFVDRIAATGGEDEAKGEHQDVLRGENHGLDSCSSHREGQIYYR